MSSVQNPSWLMIVGGYATQYADHTGNYHKINFVYSSHVSTEAGLSGEQPANMPEPMEDEEEQARKDATTPQHLLSHRRNFGNPQVHRRCQVRPEMQDLEVLACFSMEQQLCIL